MKHILTLGEAKLLESGDVVEIFNRGLPSCIQRTPLTIHEVDRCDCNQFKVNLSFVEMQKGGKFASCNLNFIGLDISHISLIKEVL